jgi:nucleoside-diphosphate-sugar epimerase
MTANCATFVLLIEAFRGAARGRLVPPEVWATGSEIECHPAFGDPVLRAYAASKRAFARHARRYARDPGLVYRHIVPSAFRSPMGPGLISGALAARAALALIRRGFCYVPVTYTGVALIGALWFWLGPVAPAPGRPTT